MDGPCRPRSRYINLEALTACASQGCSSGQWLGRGWGRVAARKPGLLALPSTSLRTSPELLDGPEWVTQARRQVLGLGQSHAPPMREGARLRSAVGCPTAPPLRSVRRPAGTRDQRVRGSQRSPRPERLQEDRGEEVGLGV